MDIKERIISACQELSRNKGFYSLTMDELAAQAGVSKRTVYRYFRSKEEIIEATLDRLMQEISQFMEDLLKQNEKPEIVISTLMKHLFIRAQFVFSQPSLEDLRIHYPELWQKIDQFRMHRIREIIGPVIGISQNPLLQQTDPRIISAIIQASIQATLNPEFLLSNHLGFEETAQQVSKLWLSALL